MARARTLLAALAAVACQAQDPPAATVDAAPADAAPEASADSEPAGCRAPAGAGSPRTVADVVALVNALPPPVTITCFLESLDRPLHANATRSVLSLQPAAGARSPRVFLVLDGLLLSVAPAGAGRRLVEMGQFVDPLRTVKAEIEFPVEAPLPPAAPFEHPRQPTGGTLCGACHASEERAPQIPYAEAFASDALRPTPASAVDLEDVRAQRAACDAAAEPERCALLGALFDHGPVLPAEFPPGLPTIFD